MYHTVKALIRKVRICKNSHPLSSHRDTDTVMGTIVDTEPPFNVQTWTNYPMTVVTSVTGYKIDYMQGPC